MVSKKPGLAGRCTGKVSPGRRALFALEGLEQSRAGGKWRWNRSKRENLSEKGSLEWEAAQESMVFLVCTSKMDCEVMSRTMAY